MKKHPLARALRIDKLSLAALEATLRLYGNPKTAAKKIPTLNMLTASENELTKKAQRLVELINKNGNSYAEVVSETGQAGGGAMPEENLPSAAVTFNTNISPQKLEAHFRLAKTPIIGRISQGRFLLDVRTLFEDDFPHIVQRFEEIIP